MMSVGKRKVSEQRRRGTFRMAEKKRGKGGKSDSNLKTRAVWVLFEGRETNEETP